MAIAVVQVTTGFASFQDYGEWVYQGRVLSDLWLGRPTVTGVSIATYPVPYSIHLVLLALLTSPLGSTVAAVATLVVYAALCGLAVDRAILRLGLAPWSATVLLGGILLGSGFWNGYLGAQLGIVIVLYYWGLGKQAEFWWTQLLFSLVLFFTHAIAFACWVVLVFARVSPSRWARVIATLTPSLALGAWYALASEGTRGSGDLHVAGPTAFAVYKAYTVAKFGGYHNLILRGEGDFTTLPGLYWGGTLLNVLFAVAFGAALLWLLLRFRASVFRSPERAAGLALLAIALVLPTSLGLVNPGERVLAHALVALTITWCRPGTSALVRRSLVLVTLAGLGATVMSCALLEAKAASGSSLSTPVLGESSRLSVLFGSRLDEFQRKAEDAGKSRSPQAPLAWQTSVLVQAGR